MGNSNINTGNTHIESQIINISLTLEQHEQRLKHREVEILTGMEHPHSIKPTVLEAESNEIKQQLQNPQASYETRIASLRKQITRAEAIRRKSPDVLLDQSIEALRQGEIEEADRLFQQIEKEDREHIRRVSEATFLRGKIAEDAIRFTMALEHYETAVYQQPDNALYLNSTGLLHLKIANNYQKALEYLGRSLASDLRIYGDDHSDVATTRNNLGFAWHSLGEYHTAIEYYELALSTFKEFLEKDHSNTKTAQNSLDTAQNALKK